MIFVVKSMVSKAKTEKSLEKWVDLNPRKSGCLEVVFQPKREKMERKIPRWREKWREKKRDNNRINTAVFDTTKFSKWLCR